MKRFIALKSLCLSSIYLQQTPAPFGNQPSLLTAECYSAAFTDSTDSLYLSLLL
jgi:hypothetical protein